MSDWYEDLPCIQPKCRAAAGVGDSYAPKATVPATSDRKVSVAIVNSRGCHSVLSALDPHLDSPSQATRAFFTLRCPRDHKA